MAHVLSASSSHQHRKSLLFSPLHFPSIPSVFILSTHQVELCMDIYLKLVVQFEQLAMQVLFLDVERMHSLLAGNYVPLFESQTLQVLVGRLEVAP